MSHPVGMIGRMLRHDVAIAKPAARASGLATRQELRDLGIANKAIDERIASGLLRPQHRGVLHHEAAPFNELTRLLAAVKACGPTAVASHRSAAVLHHLEGIRRFRPEITVCDTTKPKASGVTVHRTDTLDPADRTVVGGIAVTSIPRTLLDLGAVVPFDVVANTIEVAVIEHRVTPIQLVAVLDRLGKPGRRGTGPLRAVVRQTLPDDRLQSVLERDLLRLIKRTVAEPTELQHPVRCPDGTLAFLDFAWPQRRIAIEADGHRWHATRKQLERDLARRRAIQAAGWNHYAYGFGDVHDRPDRVLAELSHLFVALAPGNGGESDKEMVSRG